MKPIAIKHTHTIHLELSIRGYVIEFQLLYHIVIYCNRPQTIKNINNYY